MSEAEVEIIQFAKNPKLRKWLQVHIPTKVESWLEYKKRKVGRTMQVMLMEGRKQLQSIIHERRELLLI